MDYLEFESGKLKVRSVMGFLNANELVASLSKLYFISINAFYVISRDTAPLCNASHLALVVVVFDALHVYQVFQMLFLRGHIGFFEAFYLVKYKKLNN